jgi:single-stranded-DNA-specific exonuclease
MDRNIRELLPQVRAILQQRGLNTDAEIEAFINPRYETQLHDPFRMLGMREAVDRIAIALERGERMVIYGDYDIDGLTATTVLLEILGMAGADVQGYIPDRFEEGYGINLEALKKLKAGGAQLVISVDCGITSKAEVAWAMANGLDIIITDHHAVPAEIPEAVAILNPKRPGDDYPFKDLAGVGVAFKLAQALQHDLNILPEGHEKWLLDLVALGTVCDVVSLTGENRVLVHFGLKVLVRTRRVGIRALAEVGRTEVARLGSSQLGFILGPRLNAAGRLEHASKGLELLGTDDEMLAAELAQELDMLNLQRRSDQAEIFKVASEQAATQTDEPFLVLAHEDWSHGVVGIVASKIVEAFKKPAIVMQIMGDTTKGSARSLGDLNMVMALRSAEPLLLRFGGHHFAAGATLKTADLAEFQATLRDYVRTNHPNGIDEGPVRVTDLELADGELIDWPLHDQMSWLEPFGNGNLQPSIGLAGLKVLDVTTIGADRTHMRLKLADSAGRIIEGIGFGLAPKHPNLKVGQMVDVTGVLERNDFNGRSRLQLRVEELR